MFLFLVQFKLHTLTLVAALVAGHQSYHSDIVSTDSIAIKTSPIIILRVNIHWQLSFCFNSWISLEAMKHEIQNSVDLEISL